jgi:hypothetical protein
VPAVPEEKAMIPAETREKLVALLRVSLFILSDCFSVYFFIDGLNSRVCLATQFPSPRSTCRSWLDWLHPMIFSPWNLLTQKPKEIRTLKNSGKLLLMI